ncbi:MAG TPA: enoyl-ACP reductase FabI [Rhizomicrobium sp.]|nr:enoyl-ACP reductase FabI [Rhizomicrobium sp.]
MTNVHAEKRGLSMPFPGLMKGKRGLVMGVANQHSIAWGIAQALHDAGAELAFSYQGDLFRKRVVPLVEPLNPAALVDCDVSNQGSIDAAFAELGKVWDSIDFLVHAIAFSDKEQLKGRYIETTAENFRMTMDISCYSFTAVAQRAEKMMPKGGSMVTLTYLGAERNMPHYNVMGVAKAALEASVRYLAEDLGKKQIRVNSISAGPIKTLAFAGIADSRYILKWNEYNSPLRRTVTQGEVGNSALFLLSDLGSAVTGENLHVDAGYHIVGMKAEDAPDISVVQKNETS